MSRWLAVSLVLISCGGHNREVSKIKYTHSSCTEPGCSIAPDGKQQFAPPDSEREMPVHEEPHAPPTPTAKTPPPEPTCALVAESLASIELGNYADPDERAPKVAAEERRCTAMRLSRDDRQCVIDSYDRTSVAYCVPALFPKEPQPEPLTVAQCDVVAKQMMTQLEQHLRSQPIADQRVWERQLLVAIDACRTDRWNAAMGQCAAYSIPMYPQNCAYVQPTGMVKRLEARLAKARGD